MHQAKKKEYDRKGHLTNTEALLEKSKAKKDELISKIEKLSKLTDDSKLKRAEMATLIMKNKSTAKEIERSVNFTVGVEDIQMKNTIFETSDDVIVMEAVQSLIKDNVNYSDETSPDYKMFCDPDFKPTTESIYLEHDLSKADRKEFIDDKIYKIEWFRPKDIAEDDDYGFTSRSGQRREDMRISQGNLKDNWFLSALSIIRTENTLFQTLTCDQQFDRFRSYGLYIFKFYKDGSSFYVVIDDKIP